MCIPRDKEQKNKNRKDCVSKIYYPYAYIKKLKENTDYPIESFQDNNNKKAFAEGLMRHMSIGISHFSVFKFII